MNDTSLRPRPGESAEDTLARVIGAVKETHRLTTIDVDAYCTSCNSDQHTTDKERHQNMRWCTLCRNWQQELSPRIKALVVAGQEALRDA